MFVDFFFLRVNVKLKKSHPIQTRTLQPWLKYFLKIISVRVLFGNSKWELVRQSAEASSSGEIRKSPSWNINEMWEAAAIGGKHGGCWRWVGQGELQVLMETYLLFTELGLWPLGAHKKRQVANFVWPVSLGFSTTFIILAMRYLKINN